MTGQQVYLDIAQAGLAYQFDTFLDTDTGLFHEYKNQTTGAMSGALDSQKQAYGLLGPSFMYYLTGDSNIYDRIAPVEAAIQSTYRDPATGSFKARPAESGPANTIAHHLDQLNTYHTLLSAQAPLANRVDLQNKALQTAKYLRDAFYDPTTGLMRPTLDAAPGTVAGADFGHSVKSFWFIDQTAKIVGDTELSAFAQTSAKSLFQLAYQDDQQTWATGFDDAGAPNSSAHWWGFAELNQYMASLAIEDPALRPLLDITQSYWLENYVDADNGGIWLSFDIQAGVPNTTRPKHTEWKSGFHSFEHALINYLTASAMDDGLADLFFARTDIDTLDLAYGFSGQLAASGTPMFSGDPVQRVSVSGLTYSAARAAPVPLPASILMLGASLLWLRRLKR